MSGVLTEITRQTKESVDVSQQVQARLKRADELEVAVNELTDKLSDANVQIGQRDEELRALRSLELKANELDAKERLLDSREKELELRSELNDLKIESQKERVNDHKRMVELIFRNTSVRKTALFPVSQQVGGTLMHANDGPGVAVDGGSYVTQEQSDETTTEE